MTSTILSRYVLIVLYPSVCYTLEVVVVFLVCTLVCLVCTSVSRSISEHLLLEVVLLVGARSGCVQTCYYNIFDRTSTILLKSVLQPCLIELSLDALKVCFSFMLRLPML